MNEVEIAVPDTGEHILTALEVASGARIAPLTRLKTFNADEWEDVTLELVSCWKTQYARVVRCGGGGDMGRDVIAYNHDSPSVWENYQCKHYNKAINLSLGLLEIGKLFYYVHQGEYSLPQRYFFVAPQGVSTDFLKYINDPEKLKAELIARWEKICRKKITTKEDVLLGEDIRKLIDEADFSIFDYLPPIKIIELHSDTMFHAQRFSVSAKRRPALSTPPENIESKEIIYTSELLRAFADAEGKKEITSDSLPAGTEYKNEYDSARRNFYAAEDLEKFSRDWLPSNCYQELVEECYEAVSPTVQQNHVNGYARYLATSSEAVKINYNSHPLDPYIKIQDKKGICHQLVNSERIRWIKENSK